MRKRIYQIIENAEEKDTLSSIYDIFMMVVIIASLIPLTIKEGSDILNLIDYITVAIFIADYVLRLATADFKLRKGTKSFLLYPMTPMALIDLFSILPYRKVIYRCNNKYADGCKCKTPHINEDELKELFIKAANELFSEREEILANTKVMMEMVCETDSLDRDLQDSITELNIISEQMQIAIAENSRVALDQDEYEKRYAELTARYEKAKAKYDDIAEQIESKKAKRELFKGFIRTLEKQDGLMEDFDAGIWSSLVQEVIVKTKDDIRFIFKNGFEVRV